MNGIVELTGSGQTTKKASKMTCSYRTDMLGNYHGDARDRAGESLRSQGKDNEQKTRIGQVGSEIAGQIGGHDPVLLHSQEQETKQGEDEVLSSWFCREEEGRTGIDSRRKPPAKIRKHAYGGSGRPAVSVASATAPASPSPPVHEVTGL